MSYSMTSVPYVDAVYVVSSKPSDSVRIDRSSFNTTSLSEAFTSVSGLPRGSTVSVIQPHVSIDSDNTVSADDISDHGILSDLSSVDQDDQSLTESSSSSTHSASLITSVDLVSTVRQLIDMGYTHAEAKEMIVSFHRVPSTLVPDPLRTSDGLTKPKVPSDRSLRRKASRDECRRMHLSAGLCYLAPVPFSIRRSMSQSLGKNPTIKNYVTALLPYLARINIDDLYVVKVSNEALGTYHLSASSHSAVGTFAGLLNGLRDRWQGEYYALPITEGHKSFYVPKGAIIGSSVRHQSAPVPIAPAPVNVVSTLYQPMPLKQQFADILLDITDEVCFVDDIPTSMEVAYAVLTRAFVRTKSNEPGKVFIKPLSLHVPLGSQIIVKDYSAKLTALSAGYGQYSIKTLNDLASDKFDHVVYLLFEDDLTLVSREALSLICAVGSKLDIMTNVIGSPLTDLLMFSLSLTYNSVKHVVDMYKVVTDPLPIQRMGHGPPGVVTKVFLPQRISDAAKSYIQRIDSGYEYIYDQPSFSPHPVAEAFMSMRFYRIRDTFIARHYTIALSDFGSVFRRFDEQLMRIIKQHFGPNHLSFNG